MLTKRGICYDLKKSPYTYSETDITFYFSSLNHKEHFTEEKERYAQQLNVSLEKRFKCPVDAYTLALVKLYEKIETRGFCIFLKKEGYLECVEEIKFHGTISKLKN